LKRASFEELAETMAREAGVSIEVARRILLKETNDRLMDQHEETLRKLAEE
jgi:hypothetical protein